MSDDLARLMAVSDDVLARLAAQRRDDHRVRVNRAGCQQDGPLPHDHPMVDQAALVTAVAMVHETMRRCAGELIPDDPFESAMIVTRDHDGVLDGPHPPTGLLAAVYLIKLACARQLTEACFTVRHP